MSETMQAKPVLYPAGGEVTYLMPNTNALGTLKKAKKGAPLTAAYMTAEEWGKRKGKEIRCFYLGLKEAANADGEVYYLAKFSSGEENFVAAQTVLVQSVAPLPVGQGVSITCTGVEKANKGKIVRFEIADLGINLLGNEKEG